MKTTRRQLKKIIENFLFEKQDQLKSNYAIVCYSDSDFAGKAGAALLNKLGVEVEKDESRNPKGWWTNKIPQGHAWVILVSKDGKSFVCEFGSEACEYKINDDKIDKTMTWLAKKGIPFFSKTKIRKQRLSNVQGNKLTVSIVDSLVKESLKMARSDNRKVYKVSSFNKGLNAAGTNGACMPYNLIPFDFLPSSIKSISSAAGYSIEDFKFNNCGSYVSSVLGASIGFSSVSDAVDAATLPGAILEIFDKIIPDKFKTKIINGEYI